MAYAFDADSFGQLLGDVEGLVAGALDHEQRLTTLVARSDGGDASILPASAADLPAPAVRALGAGSRPAIVSPGDGQSALREICVEARHQRQLAESILARLLGDIVGGSGARTAPRVLVVDDSADSRDLAAVVLDASGFHAMTASNGLEAVLAAHYARPAVVLMDLLMPVLDGFEATRLLKASAVTRHLKVIAYTANADSSSVTLNGVFADILPKPANPDAIVEIVRRWASAERR